MLAGYVERGFQGHARLGDGAFLKQSADETHPVGNAARWGELWQGVRGVWSPVAASLRHLHEAGAQHQRGMAGEVGDGENLIAKRRDKQHIHLGEDSGHFLRYLAAEAIGLDEV